MGQPIPDDLLEIMAEKFHMLADSTRLAILRALMEGEKSVGQIVKETQRGQANVSKHLKLLSECDLIRRRKEGLQVFYALDDPLVEQLCTLVCGTIRGEVERKIIQQRALLRKIPPVR